MLAVLTKNPLALLLCNSFAFLLRLIASLGHGYLLAHLVNFVFSNILISGCAFLLVFSIAPSLGHILAVLFGHALTILPLNIALLVGNLFAHLSLLVVALVSGY